MRYSKRLVGLLVLCSVAFCVVDLVMASPATEAAVRASAALSKATNGGTIVALNAQLAEPNNTPEMTASLEAALESVEALQVVMEPMLTFPN